MKILLADDHAIVRSGLRHILADAFPDASFGEAASGAELQEKIQKTDWTVLVLDIALEDRNSLDMVEEIRNLRKGMPIIVLSMYSERQFVVRALRAGVSAYLTKDRAPEELLLAIRSVLEGKRYLSETVAKELADHVAHQGSGLEAPHELLSPREYDVFIQLAMARSVSEIAQQLCLSIKTISTYRTRILEKMGMTSNAQLIRYAIQRNLVK